MPKLNFCLGTAQFGSKYGIANKKGKTKKNEIKKILNLCKKNNIYSIDTSKEYTNVEQTLGSLNIKDFKIINKIKFGKNDLENFEKSIENKIKSSLMNLKIDNIHCLMFHNPDDLKKIDDNLLKKKLKELKKNKLIKKVGISVYDFYNLEKLIDLDLFDIIQCPFNIIDQRLQSNKILKLIKKSKIEIHIRSIFLQGLLTLHYNQIPKYFYKWKLKFKKWNNFLNQNNISGVEGCINFIKQFENFKLCVIGVEDCTQLNELIKINLQNTHYKYPSISSNNRNLINPSFWK